MTAPNVYPFTRAPEAVAEPVLFRVFWQAAGDVVFRDESGRKSAIPMVRALALKHTLHRLAMAARGRDRTRLSVIYCEITEAYRDAVNWRLASCPYRRNA